MKKILTVLAMIFILAVSTAYAEDTTTFDVVIYVGTGEAITNGNGNTPEAPCATLDDAFKLLKSNSTYIDAKSVNFVLVGNTIFQDTLTVSKSYVSITGNGTITPKARNSVKYMMEINEKSTLSLGGENSNVIIDGCSHNSEYDFVSPTYTGPKVTYIVNNGTLILQDGISIQNINIGRSNSSGYLPDISGTTKDIRPIAIANNNLLQMNGGIIKNCGSSFPITNRAGAVFNMTGGKISGTENNGSVYNKGEFNFDGGEISDVRGGISNYGTLNLKSGIISSSSYAVHGEGTYTLSDEVVIEGKIYDKDSKLVSLNSPAPSEATAEPTIEPTAEPTVEPIKETIEATIAPTITPTLEPADENDTIPVYVNSKKVKFTDAYPFIDESNRTQLPVRAVADMLNCDVSWDAESQAVIITKDDITMKLSIGSNEIIVNDKTIIMDTAAKIENDRTYIPGRYIGEALGYTVDWIDGSVMINETI
jgi:hypothetical protein